MNNYVINLVSEDGKSKIIALKADSMQRAAEKTAIKYPTYEIVRISPHKDDMDYFSSLKRIMGDQ